MPNLREHAYKFRNDFCHWSDLLNKASKLNKPNDLKATLCLLASCMKSMCR